MKEQLYTIPVNDAFSADCECPLCIMHKTLEDNAIAYTMGPSYMEEDVREKTDALGFCNEHLRMLYDNQNRLGLALILDTHLQKINNDLEKLQSNAPKIGGSLFKKKATASSIAEYLENLQSNCFVCDKINNTFSHYIATIFYLYKKDSAFQSTFQASKGFCLEHYGLLYEEAPNHLSGDTLTQFLDQLNHLFLDNMKRVKEDVDWFINKFDYRYADEPWKNSKDAVNRAIQKTNGLSL